MKKLLALAFSLCFSVVAHAATLLPQGKQQFFAPNGAPLAGGKVYFYIPGTSTPKDTYRDAAATALNTNPVQLDAGGYAVIFGSGAYRQVVKDVYGVQIYDQLTYDTSAGTSSWGGTATGSANSVIINAVAFSAVNGQEVSWKVATTNTGSASITIGPNTYLLVKDTPNGVVPLSGGEMVAGAIATATYDSVLGQMHLKVPLLVEPFVSISASPTIDLGTSLSHNVNITGSGTISSFGSSASTAFPIYDLTFNAAVTIVHNAGALIVPNQQNLLMVANSSLRVKYLGSGNWSVLSYTFPTKARNRVVFLTGTGAYTPSVGTTRIFVRFCAGGGGGGGVSGGAIVGGTGGQTVFNSIITNGGTGGNPSNNAFGAQGGPGGSAGTGTCLTRQEGFWGTLGGANASGGTVMGGNGGDSPFGGGGRSMPTSGASFLNAKGSCTGGAGAAGTVDGQGSAGGGGAGEYCEVEYVPPLAATYAYSIGAGGSAGTGTIAGGTGASGIVQIDEFKE